MKAIYVLLAIVFIAGCDKQNEQVDFVTGDKLLFTENQLITNFPFLKNFNREGVISKETCTVPTTREELQSYKTVIKIYNGKEDAGISIPGFGGLKLGKEEISYNVYYIEPAIIKCDGVEKVYGVGYSYHLLIKKLKKGLSVDKLPYIAANVQLESGKTQVYYSLQSYGISGLPIVKFFKPVVNKPYDVEGFNIMQSSIDGIHNFLGDSTLSAQLTFRPQELSFVKSSDLR